MRDTFLCKAGVDERDRRLGTLASIWLKNLYMCSLSSNFHITICKYVTQQFRRSIRNFQVLFLNYTPTPTPTPTEWHGYTCTRGSSSPYTGIRAIWITSLVPCEVVMSWIWNNVMAIQWLLLTFLHHIQWACHAAGCLWCHAVMVNLMYNKYYARRKSYWVYIVDRIGPVEMGQDACRQILSVMWLEVLASCIGTWTSELIHVVQF